MTKMIDQAEELRRIVMARKPEGKADSNLTAPVRRARVLSITSGKGGVGKTNITVNLAYALNQLNKKTLILDADLGLANVNVLLGVNGSLSIKDMLQDGKKLAEIMVSTPDDLKFLPASSGIEEMTNLSIEQRLYLKSELDQLEEEFDFVLIDTAAGIGSNVMSFNQMAQKVMVVLSPDPTSLADAYALIKVLVIKYVVEGYQIITNNTQNALEGKELFKKLERICHRFLKISIAYLGSLSTDPNLILASRNQQIVVKQYPKAKISKEINQIAKSICAIPYDHWSNRNINFLLTHVLNLG